MNTRRAVVCCLSAAIALVLVGCSGSSDTQPRSAATGPAPSASSTAPGVDWDVDLDVLLSGIETTHPNPWWRISKQEFVARLNKLRTTIPAMDRTAAEIAVLELVATIDGHTMVYPTDLGYHYYAIDVYDFIDGTFVIAAPGHPEWVGGRLTGIGAMPLQQVQGLLRPLVSHDNSQSTKAGLPLYLVMPEALHAKGIVTNLEQPQFRITTKTGQQATANPMRLSWESYQDKVGWYPVALPPRSKPLSQKHRDKVIWSTDLGHGVYYVQYNEARAGVEPTVARIEKAIGRPGFQKLVVDIRHNGGGDNTTYGPLLQELTDARLKHRLTVIIGRETFSAAEIFATELERATDVVFVGEPTGGRPDLYADVRTVRLPRSGILAHISSRYYQLGDEHDPRSTIVPDIPVTLTSADYFAHRDPILAAAVRGR